MLHSNDYDGGAAEHGFDEPLLELAQAWPNGPPYDLADWASLDVFVEEQAVAAAVEEDGVQVRYVDVGDDAPDVRGDGALDARHAEVEDGDDDAPVAEVEEE